MNDDEGDKPLFNDNALYGVVKTDRRSQEGCSRPHLRHTE
jgi:hypothetical protein